MSETEMENSNLSTPFESEVIDRLKKNFLRNISHEIRTPLNLIVGFSNLICNNELDEKLQCQCKENLLLSSDRLLKYVDNLLALSILETGLNELDVQNLELNNFGTNIYNKYLIRFSKKNISFNFKQYSLEQETINTDKEKLQQVLQHLLDNAYFHTKQGRVEFGYTISENRIVFFVLNTGIGIPEPFKESIFKPFVQISTGLNKNSEGSGIGLAICKGYVNLMGGEIWTETLPEGETGFYFWLPC